ncbi:MAG: ankyrin repeat domain-containing protein [Candidatus Amoebophilus sp.]
MKKLYSGCFIALLFVCIFNGCDECAHLPEPTKPSFEVSTSLDKDTLYLEAHDMAKITLVIEAKNEAAQKCHYTTLKWEVLSNLQGQLLDQNLAVITEDTELSNGENILYYNPLGIGHHNLKLVLVDQHRLSEQEVTLDPITVKEKKELPFYLKLETPSKSIFTHQDAKLALSIFSKEKEQKEEAAKLTYTVKEIELTKGALFLESTGEVIKTDTKLAFGKQTLLFKPSVGETGEAHLKLLVESNKGGEAVASIFLTIKPVEFKVSALLKEAPKEVANHIQEDIALLEIMLSGIDPTLVEESWKLSSWKCSDEIIRDILNEQGEELTVYPLSAKEKNKLYVKLNDLNLDGSHSLTLAIEGPGKTVKEVNLPLLPVLKNLIGIKVQALLASSEEKNKKAKNYLKIPAKASNYDSIKEAREEVEKDIDKLTDTITGIESNYGQAAAMPSIAAKHLKKAQKNIASLEKKKARLDKLKLKSSKERASFKVALQAASKSIYSHGESVIDMHISSDSPLSAKQTYEVKDIAVSGGRLVLENNHEVVEAGTKLTFGTQKLIFKPSGEIGEAVIRLIVTNEKGNESRAMLSLDVKAVSFQVALEANAKSMFVHQGAEVDLVISSDEKEAEDLVYSIKEVQGSLFLKNTGEKLEPGTKLHYGPQTLIFKPAINPKDISEYQALLEQKKSLSITQGDKKDATDQPIEGAGEVIAINTRIEDLKLVIQSFKELVVKPLGNIEANLSLSVTSQEGGEDKSLVILDVKPVGFQLGATAREAQENEKALIAGDFVVVELELSQIDPSIEKEGWSLSSFKFNNKIDPTDKTDTNTVIVDERLRELPSYELKTEGKNIFYLKLDNVDIHKFFELILIVKGPSEAVRSITLSLSPAYQNLVKQQIDRQVNVIKKEQHKIITFLQKPVKEKEYEQLLSIKGLAEKKIVAFNKEYDDKVDRSKLISSYQDEEALKTSIVEAIEEFQASIEELGREEETWNSAIAPLGNVKELAGYINSPNEAGNYLIHMWAEKEPISREAGKFILARTNEINSLNREGKTALQLAIDEVNLDKVNLLLKYKADVNIKFPDGKTALLYTLEKELQGEHALTEALLKAGANPNISLDSKGLMPLHVALQNKDLDKVTLLLKCKAIPNSKFPSGETPLAYVIKNATGTQREDLVRILIQHGAEQNALEIEKFLSVIEKLSKDINAYLANPIQQRDYDTLKLLFRQAEGQIEQFEKTLGSVVSGPKILGGALGKEIGEALNKIIDKAIPMLRKELIRAREEYKAWHESIKNSFGVNTDKEVEKYVRYLYHPTQEGNTLIHMWSDTGTYNEQAGRFILERTVDVNLKNKEGFTPLHLAIKKKNLESVKLLLEYKASPNIEFPDKSGPLVYVVDENYKDADKYGAELLAHGAKVHEKYPASRSNKYKPILMGVIMNDKLTSEVKTALVRSLVKHGVNRDEHMEDGGYSKYFNDLRGWTPLYAAMERGEVDICAILLEDIFPNLYPKTPVIWYDNHKWWITPRFIIRQGEERGIYMSGRFYELLNKYNIDDDWVCRMLVK